MKKNIHFLYPSIGVLLGLAISVTIFLVFWIMTMESEYSRKIFFFESFLFWEQCKKEGKSDLQAATERYRIIHNQPNFEAQQHPDVKNGHPDAFMRGILGYNLWDGFSYGKKPGRIETLFELNTIKDTFSIMAMMCWLPYIAMFFVPFIGWIIGLLLSIKRSNRVKCGS